MVNKVILLGNVGNDPEIRNLNDGSKVASFSLATSESWKDKNGEKQTKTEWHNVVCFKDKVNVIENYVHKGSKIYVEGSLRTRKYTDKNSIERYVTEIILSSLSLLDKKDKEETSMFDKDDQSFTEATNQENLDDGDIPF